jgi:hypothetical protein
MTQYRYVCTHCAMGWHDVPYCPYRRPEPRPITPGQMRTMRHLRELERAGRLEMARPLDMRWLWLVPPAVVVLFLLMLL